jgi:hypothetical protein
VFVIRKNHTAILYYSLIIFTSKSGLFYEKNTFSAQSQAAVAAGAFLRLCSGRGGR